MLSWLRRKLGGEGKIRVEGATQDGREFSAVLPYEGSLGTISEDELLEEIASHIFIEEGVHVKEARVVGAVGKTLENPNWDYETRHF